MSEEHWFSIGHTTHQNDRTGCTVVLFDRSVPAVADVRGGAPGTRETTLLDAGARGQVDAVVLSGGSAFGLRTADGVMQWLLERGRGVQTPAGRVPLVPAAIIYDLQVGSDRIPSVDDGYKAADNATTTGWESGLIGAGAGATVAKLEGTRSSGGVGIATIDAGGVDITAVIVLNSVGSIVNPLTGKVVTGSNRTTHQILTDLANGKAPGAVRRENTAIGSVMISAPVSRTVLTRCAIAAHNGLARSVVPAHTVLDGDAFFCIARHESVDSTDDVLKFAAGSQLAVELAIKNLFTAA